MNTTHEQRSKPVQQVSLAALSAELRIRVALEGGISSTWGGEYDARLTDQLGVSLPDLHRTLEDLALLARAEVKSAAAEKSDPLKAMSSVLDRMGEQKLILALQFHERLSFSEIAQILEISAADTRRESTKALFRMAKELREYNL